MGTIDSIKSVLTQSALDALCERFHIPDVVHPELPGRNDMILNSPAGKISLSVIAAAKVSHFEILCRVHGFVPTIGNFRRWIPLSSLLTWNDHFFWVDSAVFPLNIPLHRSNSLQKDPHPTLAEFNADVCNFISDNPAPFWKLPKPFLCFIGISRYYDLDENCYPTFWDDEDQEMDLFAFIHHVDPMKVKIWEREVREGEVLLLELTKERVVPLAGVNVQGNQDNVIPEENADAVNEDDVDAAATSQSREGDHVIRLGGIDIVADDEGRSRAFGKIEASTGGKSLAAIQELFEQSTLNVEVDVTKAVTVPFVTSSMTPTPERKGGDYTDSVTGLNMRTQKPVERFVISSNSTHDSNANAADDEVTSVVRSFVPDPTILTTTVATTVVVDASASAPRAGHELGVGQAMYYKQLLAEFNVGVARQTCFNAEVRMQLEHELREAEAAEAIRLRGQITNVETAKAAMDGQLNSLRERNTVLESATIAKDSKIAKLSQELSSLQLSYDDLSVKASTIECEKDKLANQVSVLEADCSGLRDEVLGYKLFKERIEEMQNAQIKALSNRVAGIDSNLLEMALHMDEEFYPRFLTTITGRRWILSRGVKLAVVKCLHSPLYMVALGGAIGHAIDKGMQDGLVAGIEHGKAERSPDAISAYNPFAEDNYVAAINALRM
ncbi:hypothetical protein Tco_0841468 [Tanacetum coccineum]|uniref:Transposase (Putative), gypsy type n=1 Tax=Tanacetum coccineum TaxID=301880 RepID=A0ABQ5B0S3_9ASTR